MAHVGTISRTSHLVVVKDLKPLLWGERKQIKKSYKSRYLGVWTI